MARSRHKTEFQRRIEQLAPREKTEFSLVGGEEHEENTRILKIRHKPIAWGIPLDEVVFSKWFVNFTRLSVMPWDTIITTTSTYLNTARKNIFDDFMTSECEWLVMLDSDVLTPPDFVDRMLAHNKKMVGGWYRKKSAQENYPPVVYDFDHIEDGIHKYSIRKEPGHGLESVDGAGAGCWLVHRDVVSAVGGLAFDLNQGGEDLQFCRRVKEAGFEIWVDWDCACAHCGVAIV